MCHLLQPQHKRRTPTTALTEQNEQTLVPDLYCSKHDEVFYITLFDWRLEGTQYCTQYKLSQYVVHPAFLCIYDFYHDW